MSKIGVGVGDDFPVDDGAPKIPAATNRRATTAPNTKSGSAAASPTAPSAKPGAPSARNGAIAATNSRRIGKRKAALGAMSFTKVARANSPVPAIAAAAIFRLTATAL